MDRNGKTHLKNLLRPCFYILVRFFHRFQIEQYYVKVFLLCDTLGVLFLACFFSLLLSNLFSHARVCCSDRCSSVTLLWLFYCCLCLHITIPCPLANLDQSRNSACSFYGVGSTLYWLLLFYLLCKAQSRSKDRMIEME